MKRLFFRVSLVAIAGIATFIGCTKTNEVVNNDFLPLEVKLLSTSTTIQRSANFLAEFGTIKFEDSKVKRIAIAGSDSATAVFVPISKNGKVVASIEAVKMPKGKLPNGDDYAINLIDLNSFDLGTLSGSIRMLDLNYENFLHSNIVIMDNKIKSWAGEGLSQELRDKYNQPQFKQLATQTSAVAQREHPIYGLCDTNHNHNVSFSECYKCVSDAIEADGFSSWVCDIPILGWLSCWGTTTATCVIIAGAY